MIIGVTGSTKVGKSTFIKDFITRYKKYEILDESYRDIPDLDLYEHGTEDSQRLIRDFMFKQAEETWSKRDTQRKVIHDRTLLDNLACTLYLYALGEISEEFLEESFYYTRKSMGFYHSIYIIPVREKDKIAVPDDVNRDYRDAVNALLMMMYNGYENGDELVSNIFPSDNCAHIEQIFGSRAERVGFAGMVLDEDGEILGGEIESNLNDIITNTGSEVYTGDFSEHTAPAISLKDFGFSDEEIKKNIEQHE